MNKTTQKTSESSPPQFLIPRFSSDNPDMNNILAMMEKLLHWAAIIDSSDDAIISKSVDGFITSWNKGAQKLYGYTPEEILGQPVSVLMPAEKEDDFPYIMNELKAGRKIEHYETKRKTKAGKIIDVSITVSPIKDSHGNIIGASKIARDISDRVENDKRREEFINTASHELKTPLTSQKVFGELLQQLIERDNNTEYQPYIQKINNQTKKLEKLINDLLELSRFQTGRLVMAEEVFAIDPLVEEIAHDFIKVSPHDIRVSSSADAEMIGDRDRIGQVLVNLITNAIKYSPKGDKIIITCAKRDEEILISVQDFGIGIEEQFHTKIFERFFRVTGHDEKTYPGMGIGLDFALEVVSRHGGRIWVKSTKGQGSTFFVALPVYDPNHAKSSAPNPTKN